LENPPQAVDSCIGDAGLDKLIDCSANGNDDCPDLLTSCNKMFVATMKDFPADEEYRCLPTQYCGVNGEDNTETGFYVGGVVDVSSNRDIEGLITCEAPRELAAAANVEGEPEGPDDGEPAETEGEPEGPDDGEPREDDGEPEGPDDGEPREDDGEPEGPDDGEPREDDGEPEGPDDGDAEPEMTKQ